MGSGCEVRELGTAGRSSPAPRAALGFMGLSLPGKQKEVVANNLASGLPTGRTSSHPCCHSLFYSLLASLLFPFD